MSLAWFLQRYLGQSECGKWSDSVWRQKERPLLSAVNVVDQQGIMANFPKEIAALIRSGNANAIATRIQLSSTDTPKRVFVDSLDAKKYEACALISHRRKKREHFVGTCPACMLAFQPEMRKSEILCCLFFR
jgi:hypothetical protein